MTQDKNSGCSIAPIILFALAVIAIIFLVALFGFFRKPNGDRRRNMMEATIAEHQALAASEADRNSETVVIDAADIPRLAYRHGEKLSREQFVAIMSDANATDLMRETFRKAAEGATVTWKLRADNITERSGKLTGSFQIPWEIQFKDYGQSSNITLNCEFTEQSRPDLLRVRRNDWVTVQGKLTFKNGPPAIKEARIGDNPSAEAPEKQ